MTTVANIFQSIVSPIAGNATPGQNPGTDQSAGLFAALLATVAPLTDPLGNSAAKNLPDNDDALVDEGAEAQSELFSVEGVPLEGIPVALPGPFGGGSETEVLAAVANELGSNGPNPVAGANLPPESNENTLPAPAAAPAYQAPGLLDALGGQIGTGQAPLGAPSTEIGGAGNNADGAGEPVLPATANAQGTGPGSQAPAPQVPEDPGHQAADKSVRTTGLDQAALRVGDHPGARGLEIAHQAGANSGRPVTGAGDQSESAAQTRASTAQQANADSSQRSGHSTPIARPLAGHPNLASVLEANQLTAGHPPKTMGSFTIENALAGQSIKIAPDLAANDAIANLRNVGMEPLASPIHNTAPQSIQFSPLTTGQATTTQPQLPLNAMAAHIAQQAQSGVKSFSIRLDPPELGRLDIRLNVTRDGQATTHLIVERSETLDLLQRDARHLERALQNAGLDTSKDGLTFSLKDQNSTNYGHRQDGSEDLGNADNAASGGDEDAKAAAAAAELNSRYQSFIASDRVDIRI